MTGPSGVSVTVSITSDERVSRNNSTHATSDSDSSAPASRNWRPGSGRPSSTLSDSHSHELSAETRAR
jgi:hypothetical protein